MIALFTAFGFATGIVLAAYGWPARRNTPASAERWWPNPTASPTEPWS